MMGLVRVCPHGSVWLLVAAACALLAGCGGSQPSVPAESQRNQAQQPDQHHQRSQPQRIALQSAAAAVNGTISSKFRCAKKSIWLPLSWANMPADAAEVVLYIGGDGP